MKKIIYERKDPADRSSIGYYNSQGRLITSGRGELDREFFETLGHSVISAPLDDIVGEMPEEIDVPKVEETYTLVTEGDLHPAVEHLLGLFTYKHLPPHLQDVSKPLAVLACEMVEACPNNPELTAGLRKLLEAKDCFVRARVAQGPEEET